ncbi:MAG TPA: hypothetical protein VM367_01735 [Pseudonocardia sp.]|nr:hypothetical protein [Pseudonocardia sp.]
MTTTHPNSAGPLDETETARVRRAGRLLCGSALAFLLGFAAIIVSGLVSGTIQEEDAAAERLGVGVNELPADVVAAIRADVTWFETVLISLPLLVAAVLLFLGVRAAAQAGHARRPALAAAATVLAAAATLAMLVMLVASALLERGVTGSEDVSRGAVVALTGLGCAALVAVVPVLRARGLARRTGVVVAVLGSLVVIGVWLVPPFAPFLLALVLGVALARTRTSATI